MFSTWWTGLDTNAKILIEFQTLLIGGLIVCNFYLFYIIEKCNYGLYFTGVQMFSDRNNSNRNVVNHSLNRPQ